MHHSLLAFHEKWYGYHFLLSYKIMTAVHANVQGMRGTFAS